MSVAKTLVTRWMQHMNYTTDQAARKALSISSGAIGNYKNGHSKPDPWIIEKMAKDLGEQPAGYILAIEAERKKEADPNRKALLRAASAFGKFAACILMYFAANAQNAATASALPSHFADRSTVYYVK